MKRFDIWKLSVLNVLSSPMRSALTVLGFAIGVAAVLAVLTLGEAGRQQVHSEMGRLGIDRIWVTEANGNLLPLEAGRWLASAMESEAEPLVCFPAEAASKQGRSAAMVVGCGGGYLADAALLAGRGFLPAEYRRGTGTALVGEELAQKLAVRTGDVIEVASSAFTICGIVGEKAGVGTVPLLNAVILPLETACAFTGGGISEIQLSASQNTSLQSARERAVWLMESQGYAVNATAMEVQVEAASSVMTTFVNVLKWVALVCVLVGGISVMNILLVGIRERRREIGVMKSLGTTPSQIGRLFLMEALVYAIVGGLAGIALGMVLIEAAGRSIQLHARADWRDCLLVFGCALGTGLVFGVAPAIKASFLSCVDALRQE